MVIVIRSQQRVCLVNIKGEFQNRCSQIIAAAGHQWYDWVLFVIISQFQELLSLAKRKRVDAGEQDEPVNKPAASTDSETSDSDDEV